MIQKTLLSFIAFAGLVPAISTAQVASNNNHQLVGYTDLVQRIDSMESELASYRMHSLETTNAANCGEACCDTNFGNTTCCSRSGWYAGFDVVYAKPYFEDGIEPGDPNYDFEFSPRVILGFKNDCGTGIRTRGYWYEAESDTSDGTGFIAPGIVTQIEMNVFDLEVTKDICCGPIQTTVFAGIRYADLDHFILIGPNEFQSVNGWGPSIGIDTLTPLTCGTSFIGNLRYAALFGDTDFSSAFPADDKLFNSIDTQLGLQWEREVGCGVFRLNGIVETQLWMGTLDDTTGVDGTPDDDVLLLGFVLGAEFQR